MPTDRLDLRQADTSPAPDDAAEVAFTESGEDLQVCSECGRAMGAIAVGRERAEPIAEARDQAIETSLSINQQLELLELLKGVVDPSERVRLVRTFKDRVAPKNAYIKRMISQKGVKRSQL